MVTIFSEKIIWTFSGATILLMFFYILLRLLLKNHGKNEVLWAKLELIWVFVGFFGVLTAINAERLEYQLNVVSFLKSKIEEYSNRVLNSLNLPIPCLKYDQRKAKLTDSISQSEIDEICNWKNQISKEIYSYDNAEPIGAIPKSVKGVIYPATYYYNLLENTISAYNFAIEEIRFLKLWNTIKESLGFILFMLAFALRIIIARRKIIKVTG